MTRRKKCPEKVIKAIEGAFRTSAALETCLKSDFDNPLSEYRYAYRESQEKFLNEIAKLLTKFAQQPLISAFLVWVEDMRTIKPEVITLAHFLISENILRFYDLEKNFLPISSVRDFDHNGIINKIRSQIWLPLAEREDLVSVYINFTWWLEQETFDYVSRAMDPDEIKRQGRGIGHIMFIRLLDCLDEKMQLVAKLLYFGGSRTLEEVLSLRLENVDFKRELIRYRSQLISYPSHVFSDIKRFIQDRDSSEKRVFVGRQNANLNPATVFRNFKEAGSRVGLGDSFSPKSLTTNV